MSPALVRMTPAQVAGWTPPVDSAGEPPSPVFVVGSDLRSGGLEPWNLVEGRLESLSTPNAVAVDRSYFDRLGISGTPTLVAQDGRVLAGAAGLPQIEAWLARATVDTAR